jgi:hypothetical protein
MLIFLHDSIGESVANESLSETEISGLEDIASVIRTGEHLVIGGFSSLKQLRSAMHLGASARAAYAGVLSRYSQLNSVIDKVSVYAEVICGEGEPYIDESSGQRVIKIPLSFVTRMNLKSPVEIIFEDMGDSNIYEIISRWHTEKTFGVGLLNRRYRPIHGGGGRTCVVYQGAQDLNNIFCICVTDTDKKYPAADCGPTSVRVREVDDVLKVLTFHLDLNFHEIENLLPLSFLESNASSRHAVEIINKLRLAEANGYPEAKLFLDFKQGIKLCYLRINADAMRYWGAALSLPDAACGTQAEVRYCTCEIIKPWPSKAEIRAQINSLARIFPDECPVLNDLWKDIGSTLMSWSAAAIPRMT